MYLTSFLQLIGLLEARTSISWTTGCGQYWREWYAKKKKKHPSVDSLKRSLKKAVVDFPLETLRNCIDEWPQRLRDCIKAKGGHFEK